MVPPAAGGKSAERKPTPVSTVGPEAAAEGEVRTLEVPAARVAALRFRGPYAEPERACNWLCGEWERYVEDPKRTPPPALLTDTMLPPEKRVAAA